MAEANQAVTGYAKVQGGELYYEVIGEGHPLILIHAGVANCSMWDEQVPVFAQHYRVIRYDTRGFGKTKSENVSFSNRQDLYDLLEQLGVDKAYVLGLSRGGQIAIDFTLEFPQKVAALIPVAAGLSGFSDFEPPEIEMKKFMEMEEAEKNKDFARVAQLDVEMWADGPYRNGQADSKVRDSIYQMSLANYTEHSEEELQAQPLNPPAVGRLSEIKVPTLVMLGDIDEAATMVMADAMVQGIAGAKKIVFPGVAHMVNMEEPERFNREVLGFLSTL